MLYMCHTTQAEAVNAEQTALLHSTQEDYDVLQSVIDEVSLYLIYIHYAYCFPIYI
jgi:hypothetical protein